MSFVWPGSYWPTDYWPYAYWHVIDGEEPPVDLLPDAAWVNGVYVLILVANDNGVPVGELTAEIDNLSWLLNDHGQARLQVPSGTAAHLMEMGNRLLIFLDNGLPPWAGFIDPPRGWRYGSVSLTAYSGERLLTHRLTGRNRAFAGATAGSILIALLKEQAGPRVIEPGYIDLGGAPLTDVYHYEELYEVLRSDIFAGVDFHVSGAMEGGRIKFRLHLYPRRGKDLPNIWLLEGHNASDMEPEEQGPIVNEWLMAGAGSGWGDLDRIYAAVRDDDSAARFGLRQASRIFSDVRDIATLEALAAVELAATAEPYVAIPLNAINLPPARFADYDIGDGVGVELYTMMNGYRGTRRVVGRNWRPEAGVVETVLV